MKLIQDDAVIDKIVQLVMDVQNQENTTIPLLEKQLREVNKKLDNLMKAIVDGLYTRTTKERLEALEIQKDELTAKIADEKLKKPSFNEDFIRFWLMKFRKFDISQKKQRKALIEIFVNAIFLYDDRMLITFNYKDGTQTVRFEDTLTADCGEKSLRLRSNESPSGPFEQQNGLAQARWRGLAPTSSDLSSSAGPFRTNDFTLEIVGSFFVYLLVLWGTATRARFQIIDLKGTTPSVAAYKPLLGATIKRHNKLTARAGEQPLLRPLRLPQKSGKQILKKILKPLDNAPSSLYTMHCEQRSC